MSTYTSYSSDISMGNFTLGDCAQYWNNQQEIFLTRKQLKDYCSDKEVNKEIFESIDERVPFGTDTLEQLNKAGITSDFLKELNRERKLKRILK